MKLCKDCKFAKVGLISRLLSGWRFAHCYHPVIGTKRMTKNPVTGLWSTAGYWFCDTLRGASQDCGFYGRYWEPKQ